MAKPDGHEATRAARRERVKDREHDKRPASKPPGKPRAKPLEVDGLAWPEGSKLSRRAQQRVEGSRARPDAAEMARLMALPPEERKP